MPIPSFPPPRAALLCALAALLSLPAGAADLPKRKSGLWEIHTRVTGMPDTGPVKICIDEAKDNLLQDPAGQKPDCSTMDIKQSAGKITVRTVCRMDKTTVTTTGVLTGDFSQGYRSDMSIRYDPPMPGMGETKVAQETRWLGPCAKGQKPGDVILPDGSSFNPAQAMQPPAMQDMPRHRH